MPDIRDEFHPDEQYQVLDILLKLKIESYLSILVIDWKISSHHAKLNKK
jgi:hypothetical protein